MCLNKTSVLIRLRFVECLEGLEECWHDSLEFPFFFLFLSPFERETEPKTRHLPCRLEWNETIHTHPFFTPFLGLFVKNRRLKVAKT